MALGIFWDFAFIYAGKDFSFSLLSGVFSRWMHLGSGQQTLLGKKLTMVYEWESQNTTFSKYATCAFASSVTVTTIIEHGEHGEELIAKNIRIPGPMQSY